MRLNRYLGSMLVLLLTMILIPGATASSSPSGTPAGTTTVVLVIVAVILGFLFFYGGIKYVTPDNVLDTETRKHLYEYIDEYPGSHLREIARELDLKPSNAAWHLRKLEQTNLVRSRLIGGKKVYYLVEGGLEVRQRAIAESVLRNQNARDILQYVIDHPGKHLLEIAHALNMNHHVIKWHLNKMHFAELVEGDTTNSAYPVYYPTDNGKEAIILCQHDPMKMMMTKTT